MVVSDGINSLSVGVHELAVAVERYSLSLVAQGMIDVTTLPWYTPSYVPGDSIKLSKKLGRNEAKECNIETASQDDTTFGAHKTEDDNFNKYDSGELQAHVMNLELDSGADVGGSTMRDVVELTHNLPDEIGEPLSLNSSYLTLFLGAHQVFDTSPELSSCSNRAQLARVSHEMLLLNAQTLFDKMPIPSFMLEMARGVTAHLCPKQQDHLFNEMPEPILSRDHIAYFVKDDSEDVGVYENEELQHDRFTQHTHCFLTKALPVEFVVESDDLQLFNAQKVLDEISESKHKSASPIVLSLESKNVTTLTPFQVAILTLPFVDVENEVSWWGEICMSSECVVWKTMSDSIYYHIIFDPGILLLFINIAKLGPNTMFYESRNGWESNISYKEAHSWGNSTVGLGFREVPNNITELSSFQHNADCSQFYSIVIVLATRFDPNESSCLVEVALAFHVYGVVVVVYSDFNEDVDLIVTKRVVTYILVLTLEDKGVFKEVGMDSVGRLLLSLATSTWMVICTKIFALRNSAGYFAAMKHWVASNFTSTFHTDLNGVQVFDPGGLGFCNWSKMEYMSDCLTWWYNCSRGQHHIVFDPGIFSLFIRIAETGPYAMGFELKRGWESEVYFNIHSWGYVLVGLVLTEGFRNTFQLPSNHNCDASCLPAYAFRENVVTIVTSRNNESVDMVSIHFQELDHVILKLDSSIHMQEIQSTSFGLEASRPLLFCTLTLEDKGGFEEVRSDTGLACYVLMTMLARCLVFDPGGMLNKLWAVTLKALLKADASMSLDSVKVFDPEGIDESVIGGIWCLSVIFKMMKDSTMMNLLMYDLHKQNDTIFVFDPGGRYNCSCRYLTTRTATGSTYQQLSFDMRDATINVIYSRLTLILEDKDHFKGWVLIHTKIMMKGSLVIVLLFLITQGNIAYIMGLVSLY